MVSPWSAPPGFSDAVIATVTIQGFCTTLLHTQPSPTVALQHQPRHLQSQFVFVAVKMKMDVLTYWRFLQVLAPLQIVIRVLCSYRKKDFPISTIIIEKKKPPTQNLAFLAATIIKKYFFYYYLLGTNQFISVDRAPLSASFLHWHSIKVVPLQKGG